jgi:DNA (cytosine-5)-methyltransferase 1
MTKKKYLTFLGKKTEQFVEDSLKLKPSVVPEELTIQYWFEKNDILNHENQSKHFTPKAGLAKFLSVDEGDDSKKIIQKITQMEVFSNCSLW